MSHLLILLIGSAMAQVYHTEQMDMRAMDNYVMQWGINGEMLEVKVVAKTTGWVGWGLSPNGGMIGSDVVMG
jgi:hypothetical protein